MSNLLAEKLITIFLEGTFSPVQIIESAIMYNHHQYQQRRNQQKSLFAFVDFCKEEKEEETPVVNLPNLFSDERIDRKKKKSEEVEIEPPVLD